MGEHKHKKLKIGLGVLVVLLLILGVALNYWATGKLPSAGGVIHRTQALLNGEAEVRAAPLDPSATTSAAQSAESNIEVDPSSDPSIEPTSDFSAEGEPATAKPEHPDPNKDKEKAKESRPLPFTNPVGL